MSVHSEIFLGTGPKGRPPNCRWQLLDGWLRKYRANDRFIEPPEMSDDVGIGVDMESESVPQPSSLTSMNPSVRRVELRFSVALIPCITRSCSIVSALATRANWRRPRPAN